MGHGPNMDRSDVDAKPTVVVLGGGLAGITAGLTLREQGYPVTLVEARQFLGGRVFSFTDQATGHRVDNGQHIFLSCCTNLLRLLRELGVLPQCHLQTRLRVPVRDQDGGMALLAAAPLPAPLHLLPALLCYPHLSLLDKWRVVSTLAQVKFMDLRQPSLEGISFYQWLRARGHSQRAVEKWWDFLAAPTLNDHVQDVSARMGLMIFQEGVLAGRHHTDLGYPVDDLSACIGAPAQAKLQALGVVLQLGSPVRRLVVESGQVKRVELAGGEVVAGQVYVSALPFNGLLAALPESVAGDPFFHRLQELQFSPIVNVNLWYDRQVMDEEFCAFVDGPLQWVFNRTRIRARLAGVAADGWGQHLCISLSAAWEYIDQDREELSQRFIAAMAEAFPRARDATVHRAVVVKQRHATFRCLPGASHHRPGSWTPISNLFLAGEWTDTGWPSTMEGAVRSGFNAAQAVTETLGRR
ncbi:MAG: FAD-dependent oxidoreductase [Dehalococcoidia bacterium]|nr:FAD-dependent oxidoreductase [Dehalococcoidia bacterium]